MASGKLLHLSEPQFSFCEMWIQAFQDLVSWIVVSLNGDSSWGALSMMTSGLEEAQEVPALCPLQWLLPWNLACCAPPPSWPPCGGLRTCWAQRGRGGPFLTVRKDLGSPDHEHAGQVGCPPSLLGQGCHPLLCFCRDWCVSHGNSPGRGMSPFPGVGWGVD